VDKDERAGVATQSERLAEAIADAIRTGEFPPGRRLEEGWLAERFEVSRTPVREALRNLGASGLIEIKPRRGATVASANPAQLEVLFGAMAEIEAVCARLAAMSMTPLERRRLEALHERMGALAGRDDREAYAAANVTFHLTIYAGAHNEVLGEFARSLRRRLAPFRRAQFRAEGRTARSHVEHGAAVTAILACDAAAAQDAMFRHMSLVEDAFGQLGALSGQAAKRRAGESG
jgi:DNA-binding GntR family transcriptional regulator